MINQLPRLMRFRSLRRQHSVPAQMNKSSVYGGVFSLLGMLLFGLFLSSYAHAQCTSWFLSNPPPGYEIPSTPVAQGPYSTPAQACIAYSGTFIGQSGTLAYVYKQGGSATSSGYRPGSYFCSYTLTKPIPRTPPIQTYSATSSFVALPTSC